MRKFRIGSAFGIPILLDVTFLLVLPLFAYLIGQQIGSIVDLLNTTWSANIDLATVTAGNTEWLLGGVAAVGLFTGVVLHELGHSVVAMRYGYPIDSITLWLFGGIASLSEMPEDWKQELVIAIAGPIVSVILGVGCYVAMVSLPASLDAVRFVVGYLALLNVVLAAFNMLPGFPMDGGRVLRALLARNRPYARATQIAAEVGKAFALLLGLLGLLVFNIIYIGLAFFIYVGASSESQQVTMKAAFEGVQVRDLMTGREDLHTVTPDTTVAELMDRMLSERHTGYPVLDDAGNLAGLVTLGDAREVREVEREAYTVEEVMTTELMTVSPDDDAMSAIQTIQGNGVGRLLVTDETGALVGLVSRTDVMTAFDIIQTTGSYERSERPRMAG